MTHMSTKIQIKHRYTDAVLFECEAPEGLASALHTRHALESAAKAGTNLTGACLAGAELSGIYIPGAFLTGACLDGSNLDGAYLPGADLTGADLDCASLDGAYRAQIMRTKAAQASNAQRAEAQPMTDAMFLERLLSEGSQELVGLTTFVNHSIQGRGRVQLLASAVLIRDFIYRCHKIGD